MDVSQRTNELNSLFGFEKETALKESGLVIKPYKFMQTEKSGEIACFQKDLEMTGFCPVTDDHIVENKLFTYTIFAPEGPTEFSKAILLLHGLNERSWEKYLTWAEYLAVNTGKPVILFPIAFHMNRAPGLWCNPREIQPWVKQRKEKLCDIANSTFVNVALSSRLSCHPLRFYASGRESAFNLSQLVSEIKKGNHPLFSKNTDIDIFAYSIGALLAQVVLLANPDNLFEDSRLFMFCGGSIFSQMNGNARDIMDKEAYDRLQLFFTTDFLHRDRRIPASFLNDNMEEAFKAMIRPEVMRHFRENFFQRACNRIRAVSLKKDLVMPTQGIIRALGKASGKILEELDFPFSYTHQKPFPVNARIDSLSLNYAFDTVFCKAARFLQG